jgi:coenzyme F420-0:L-glutamate ligase/coenzyme F420-1:gamma-L-glutamate ligase
MAAAWRRDLAELDGFSDENIRRRLRRGDVLRQAPELVVPFVEMEGTAHPYPDRARRDHERDLFVLSGGAAVQNFMIAVATRGAASAWVSSTVFCPAVVANSLGIPDSWQPLGAIAVGYPAQSAPQRPPSEVTDFYRLVTD